LQTDVRVGKVKVTLRPIMSRPVRLGVTLTSGTRDQFFYLLEIFFETVTVCYVVAPSLMRGWDVGKVGVGVVLAADSQSTGKSGYRASLWDP
jgi:hypothetical protein